jgi:hypothetical protein
MSLLKKVVAVADARRQFQNLEDEEYLLLEAVTRGLVKR